MKSCRVFFRDTQGIEHAVYVNAAHRYHAFGLAMFKMRKCSWCHPDYRGVQKLSIQLLEGVQGRNRIDVTREEFEAWLKQDGPRSRGDKIREYFLMLFGRIAPSRDFKRGISMR